MCACAFFNWKRGISGGERNKVIGEMRKKRYYIKYGVLEEIRGESKC